MVELLLWPDVITQSTGESYIMDDIQTEADGQLALTLSTEYLFLPSCLYGFHNTETTVETAKSKRTIYCHRGFLDLPEEERVCTCGQRMHINSHPDIYIRHLSIGGNKKFDRSE